MPPVRQTDFSGGELDPKLWGRTDLAKHAKGLKTCKNFFISKHGEAVSRPGTQLVEELASTGPLQLVDFVYSDSVAYVLEFTHEKIRFFTSGAVVESSPGVAYELASPYDEDDLAKLRWIQSGDVLTLVCEGYAPRELRRVTSTSFTLEELSFESEDVYFRDVDSPYTGTAGFLVVDSTIGTPDASHPETEIRYKVTVLAQDTDGRRFETLPFDVTLSYDGTDPGLASTSALSELLAVYSDMALTLRRSVPAFPIFEPTWKALAFNIYKGKGLLYGFIGQTTGRDFIDNGIAPDYGKQPPLGQHPFEVVDNEGVLQRTETPRSVAYFQERLMFGGTAERPGHLWGSAVGNYPNFDLYSLAPAGSAVLFELFTRRRQAIRHMLEQNRLLIFTDSTVWTIRGHEGSPLDKNSVDAKVVEDVGISNVRPLPVEGCVLYARAKGRGVRALVPAGTANDSGYKGLDVSVISQHLFLGDVFETGTHGTPSNSSDDLPIATPVGNRSIISWCYAEDPWGLIWAVRDDGVLLSLQFDPEQQVWAWSQHETDGEVLAVCAIPEDDEDRVYLAVERDNGRYLERMASRVRKGGPSDDAAVDSAVVYEGAPTTTITGLDHLEGQQVYAVAYGMAPQGPYTVSGGAIELDEEPPAYFEVAGVDFVRVHVGLKFTPQLETLDLRQASIAGRQKTVVAVYFEVEQSKGLWAGQDFEHMAEWRQRTVGDAFAAVSAATDLVKVMVPGTWNRSARAALEQRAPLPVTVLGITREVDVGGD